MVSIPHRFNSHFKDIYPVRTSRWSFNPSQVQFTLIATTADRKIYVRFNPSQVQFTLAELILFPVEVNKVSIPHRFNSHRGTLYVPLQREKVSIPHRFNSHSHIPSGRSKRLTCFNPSQVQFTLNLLGNHALIPFRFNPSQVQFTH